VFAALAVWSAVERMRIPFLICSLGAVFFAFAVAFEWWCVLRKRGESYPPNCEHCGYSLRGLDQRPGLRCPECGKLVSLDKDPDNGEMAD
jgi:hypothetical protein